MSEVTAWQISARRHGRVAAAFASARRRKDEEGISIGGDTRAAPWPGRQHDYRQRARRAMMQPLPRRKSAHHFRPAFYIAFHISRVEGICI